MIANNHPHDLIFCELQFHATKIAMSTRNSKRRVLRVLKEQRATTTEQARQHLKRAIMFDRIALILSIVALAASAVALAMVIHLMP